MEVRLRHTAYGKCKIRMHENQEKSKIKTGNKETQKTGNAEDRK